MACPTPPFHAHNTNFAYQLHYHIGFRTRQGVPVFRDHQRAEFLRTAIADTCREKQYHTLEVETDESWVRLLLSLRPEHAPAKVVQAIKAIAGRAVRSAFPDIQRKMGEGSLWARGYYLRSVGDVSNEVVRAYIATQRQHHEQDRGDARVLAEYQHPHPETFFRLRSFAHSVAEYNCHLVLCPLRHVPAIALEYAAPMLNYLLRVAEAKAFDVISLTILEDHLHLFAALRPDQSPDYVAFAVMNNASHWIQQHNPGAIRLWNAPGFWTPSAFLRTAGSVTTNHVRAHLRSKKPPFQQ